MIHSNQPVEVTTERRYNSNGNGNGNSTENFSDRVHWGAIIAGLVVAISSQLLLSAIGAAMGFGNIADSGAPRSDSDNVAGAVGIWTIISLFISLFIGGWITARSFGSVNRSTAALNGAILWATTVAISAWLLASGVSGAFGLAAANADKIANQAQQNGITLPDVRNTNPSGTPNSGTPNSGTPSPIPTLSAQQTREVASNSSKASWGFTFGSLLGLAAAMAGASVGARSIHSQKTNYNNHSQA